LKYCKVFQNEIRTNDIIHFKLKKKTYYCLIFSFLALSALGQNNDVVGNSYRGGTMQNTMLSSLNPWFFFGS
ncbi:hypothetical protein, partial [Niabella ginsengisoli]